MKKYLKGIEGKRLSGDAKIKPNAIRIYFNNLLIILK